MKERKQDSSSTDERDRARAVNLAWAEVQDARTYTSRTLRVEDALERWTDHCPDFMKGNEMYVRVEEMYKRFWIEYQRAEKLENEILKKAWRLEDGEK